MANPNPTPPPEETRWKPGQSGNPKGPKPGYIHLSTRIQRMLNDDDFTTEWLDKEGNRIEFKGNPAEAIIKTAIAKANQGDKQWADWLAIHGYGTKQVIEIPKNPARDVLEAAGLMEGTDDGQITPDSEGTSKEQT